MFEAFVITLREGVEAALVVCLVLAYLAKTNRPQLRRPVLWGFAAAVGASVAVAAGLLALGVDPENEAVEGVLFLVSAVFVASMVVWMWRHGKKLKKEIETKLDALSAAPGAGQKFGLFLFTFLMVGREGVETVLFLAASSLSSEAVMTLIGGLAGIAVSVALGVAFLKGSLRVDLRKFFAVTTAMLLIFAVQLLVGAFHEFIEAGVLRVGDPARYMALVGPLVRSSALFVLAVLVLPFALLATAALRPAPAEAASNPAEERKRRAARRSERIWKASFAALAAVAILSVGAGHVYASRELELSPTVVLEPRDGAVRVPLSELKVGEMGRYGVRSGDRVIRFLVYRAADRPLTAFDACLLCGDLGYVQQGEHILCRNCAAEIHAPTIGFEGGCNPIPLSSRHEGESVVVSVADLEARRDDFKTMPLQKCRFCAMTFKSDASGRNVCDMEECVRKADDVR